MMSGGKVSEEEGTGRNCFVAATAAPRGDRSSGASIRGDEKPREVLLVRACMEIRESRVFVIGL